MAKDQPTAPRKTTAKATAAKAPAPRKAPAKKAPAKAPATATGRRAPVPTAASAFPTLPEAGWYLDPVDQTVQRWWDGEGWSGPPLPADEQPPDGPMRDEADTTAAKAPAPGNADRITGTIKHKGRTMRVVMPTADQLAIWQRIATRLNQAKTLDTAEVMKLLQRAITLIGSVLVDEVDRDWVEEAILAGDLDLMDAAAIFTLAIGELTAQSEKLASRAKADYNRAVNKAHARARRSTR